MISWPIQEKNPHNLYLIIGEFYTEYDISILSEFYRDLDYLYPFRFSVSENVCYNAKDISCLQEKYNMTVKPQLIGKTESKILTLRTPILYDISCMVPLFPDKNHRYVYKQKTDLVCVVLPYTDPIHRGKLLEKVIDYGPGFFLLVGGIEKSNKDSIATLASRFLLSRNIPKERILKIGEGKVPDCILESIEVFNMTTAEDYDVVIACRYNNIKNVATSIRLWRKAGIIDKNIRYICPY